MTFHAPGYFILVLKDGKNGTALLQRNLQISRRYEVVSIIILSLRVFVWNAYFHLNTFLITQNGGIYTKV